MRLLTILLAISALSLCAESRLRENWNSGWLFARQQHGTGSLGSFDRENLVAARVEPRFARATEPDYDDSSWQPVALPHTWNAHDPMDQQPGYWRGIGWYRKHFQLDARFDARRIFLEFEGANAVAELWLNGRHIGLHKGGYTGFEFDVTSAVRFGAAGNVLTVKVDNLFHDTLPPTVKTDYVFYGGIYRNAWLRVSDPVYLSDVHWTTPDVSASSARLEVASDVTNRTADDVRLEVRHQLLDPAGAVLQSFSQPLTIAAGATAPITQSARAIDHPQLWSPDSPSVYHIRTELLRAGRVIDSTTIPLGFRWFSFDPQRGFFLNGSRLQIRGTNWHQFYPGMGSAVPDSRHRQDMRLIRDMGVNFWRTSHYPHAVSTLDASDQLGLMVWEELPINKEIGNPAEYTANVLNMAREMLLRDRNHPSIIVWGIAGEINAPRSVSRQVVGDTARFYRRMDGSRPVVMHAPRGEDIEALVDVVALDIGPETDAKHQKFPRRPFLIGEYSVALSRRGLYGNEPHSDDAAAAIHERHLADLNLRPWMAGGCIWHQMDYEGESYDVIEPHIAAFGVNDIWRIPKEAYFFYQSQWIRQPMVHIVGHWTWPGEEGRTRVVKVYSNTASVELFLNGRSLGKPAVDTYPGLEHPPLVWRVPYEKGTLRAVAHAGGQEVADQRTTAGAPWQILLATDTPRLLSGDPQSLAYLTATVADRNGTPIPNAAHPISFTLYGPGELMEQTWPGYGTGLTWPAVGGITRIALRSTPRSGSAVISATSPGLRMGRVEVTITAPGKPDEMNYKERFEEDEVAPPIR